MATPSHFKFEAAPPTRYTSSSIDVCQERCVCHVLDLAVLLGIDRFQREDGMFRSCGRGHCLPWRKC